MSSQAAMLRTGATSVHYDHLLKLLLIGDSGACARTGGRLTTRNRFARRRWQELPAVAFQRRSVYDEFHHHHRVRLGLDGRDDARTRDARETDERFGDA